MSFSADEYLRAQAARVEAALEQALARVAGLATARLREAMSYSLMAGGKRLRPVLVLASEQALGFPESRACRDFACALEMVHTYSLIHDDLPAMDDDDLRRGKPTSHKAFGEANAILAGDALLTDAFTLVASGAGEAEHRLALCAELGRSAGALGMVGGQVDDVAGLAKTLAELEGLHARKTGALIRAACRGPALAPGTDSKFLDALTRYGEKLGVAFQIADDLLDVLGTAKKMGKQTQKDADKGRVGYPQLLGIDGAKRAADEAMQQAIDALAVLPGETTALAELARYTVKRDR
jgi:geranylgeranyl diphosphate synthase, type II